MVEQGVYVELPPTCAHGYPWQGDECPKCAALLPLELDAFARHLAESLRGKRSTD